MGIDDDKSSSMDGSNKDSTEVDTHMDIDDHKKESEKNLRPGGKSSSLQKVLTSSTTDDDKGMPTIVETNHNRKIYGGNEDNMELDKKWHMIKVMFPAKIEDNSNIRTPDFIESGDDNTPLERHPIMNAIRKLVNAIGKKKPQVQVMSSYRKFVLDPKACADCWSINDVKRYFSYSIAKKNGGKNVCVILHINYGSSNNWEFKRSIMDTLREGSFWINEYQGPLKLVETTQLGFLPRVHNELHRKKLQERLTYSVNNHWFSRQDELTKYANQHSELRYWKGEENLPEVQVTVSWLPGLVQQDGQRGSRVQVLAVSVPRNIRSIYRRIIYDACKTINVEYMDFSLKYEHKDVYDKAVRDHQEFMHFHKHIHIHGLQREEFYNIQDALIAVPSVTAVDDTVITDRNGTFVLIMKHPFEAKDLASIDDILSKTKLSADREYTFSPHRKRQPMELLGMQQVNQQANQYKNFRATPVPSTSAWGTSLYPTPPQSITTKRNQKGTKSTASVGSIEGTVTTTMDDMQDIRQVVETMKHDMTRLQQQNSNQKIELSALKQRMTIGENKTSTLRNQNDGIVIKQKQSEAEIQKQEDNMKKLQNTTTQETSSPDRTKQRQSNPDHIPGIINFDPYATGSNFHHQTGPATAMTYTNESDDLNMNMETNNDSNHQHQLTIDDILVDTEEEDECLSGADLVDTEEEDECLSGADTLIPEDTMDYLGSDTSIGTRDYNSEETATVVEETMSITDHNFNNFIDTTNEFQPVQNGSPSQRDREDSDSSGSDGEDSSDEGDDDDNTAGNCDVTTTEERKIALLQSNFKESNNTEFDIPELICRNDNYDGDNETHSKEFNAEDQAGKQLSLDDRLSKLKEAITEIKRVIDEAKGNNNNKTERDEENDETEDEDEQSNERSVADDTNIPALVRRWNSNDDSSADDDDSYFVPSDEDESIISDKDNIINMVIDGATTAPRQGETPELVVEERIPATIDGVITATDDTESEPIGGTMNYPKAPGMIRISGCNPNGIKSNQLGNQLQHSLDLEIDIQCYSEVNTNFLKTDVRQQFLEGTRRMDRSSRSVWGTSQYVTDSNFKPGGTAIISMGKNGGRVKKSGIDKLGRWTYQLLDGQGSKDVLIVSIYQCCKQPTNPQGTTAYHQQQVLLSEMDRNDLDPRRNFYRDLKQLICTHTTYNNETEVTPIIIGDWNEECKGSSTSQKLCNEFGLVNVFDRMYPDQKPFKTYMRGSRTIDFVLAPPSIADRVTNFVYEPISVSAQKLAGRKYGITRTYLVHAKTLEEAEFKLKTSTKISDTSYRHCIKFPIHGTGQGSTNSPMIWCFISSVLFQCHNQRAHGMLFESPSKDMIVRFNMVGFVDDSTCITGGNKNDTLQDLIRKMKEDAQLWHDLLWCSGGKLELPKCGYHVIHFEYENSGIPTMIVSPGDSILLQNEHGNDVKIESKNIFQPRTNLGHIKGPMQRGITQTETVAEKGTRLTNSIVKCGCSRTETRLLYDTVWKPAIEYVIPQSFLSDKQLSKIEKACMPQIYAKCGFNRNTSRALLAEDERMAELEAQVLRGNHKSATSDPEGTDKMTGKDVKKGFSLPFPASIVTKIKQGLVQPAGKVSQHSLTATGSRMLKDRLTHDLSFWLTEDYASVNSRCDFDKYPPIIYGSCLIRTIHYIVALRAAFPDERILISKFDFSDAYRRMAHDAAAAAQSILIVNHIAYLALRLSFGGAMNPAAWSCCSEMITDLSNELPLMEDWNPEEICSPDQHKVQAPIYESDQCAPAPAKPLSVHIPVTALGRSDCFIDDIIVVMIDRPEQILRHSSAAPLAIHCAMRPNAGVEKEPIPRRDAMAGEKLVAEGSPAESQICLGWTINTRLLLLLLPLDKFSAWSADIVDLLGRPDRVVTRPELETLIGRLNHASFVIPLSRHFLSNLRSKLKIRPRPNSRAKSKPKSNPSTEPRSTEPRPEPRPTEPRTDPSQAPIPGTASESSSDNRTVFQRVAGKVTGLVTKATSKTQFRWLRNQTYRLSDEDCSDLRLWLLLLEKAAKGISLNGLTMRNPTMLSVSDSCPFGLGGFTSNGSAWRLQVSESSPIYGNCISNNALEFLAMGHHDLADSD
ncbi:hypothetical protein FRACYDRAFT_257959 [Fragilariopsis cylindrus CCMP1102]|uniref:Uncharacterized protein n=1 Tax=Fragilariopsis cylindrus CCMP1102 TaxID=635003 RepID=A0A1E7EIY3_9STRA|nr:hypothetical protein FRACYDRAFT_257959 [Fragilariopsis cylindrus CCMP1102]|eukprot:OEU05830.1 hypothetical protein FRACYDRAFT_257959 [Fragilariopsis cylindrus CCMP1102]